MREAQLEIRGPQLCAEDRMRIFDILQAFVGNITYKPGWKFTVCPVDNYWYSTVAILMPVIDVATGKPIEVFGSATFPNVDILEGKFPLEAMVMRMEYGIHDMEVHEMHEWLKHEGMHVKDPHPWRETWKIEGFDTT
jgi:hypothetical protein